MLWALRYSRAPRRRAFGPPPVGPRCFRSVRARAAPLWGAVPVTGRPHPPGPSPRAPAPGPANNDGNQQFSQHFNKKGLAFRCDLWYTMVVALAPLLMIAYTPRKGPYIRRVLLGGQASGARFFRSLLPLPGRVYWPPPPPPSPAKPGRSHRAEGAPGMVRRGRQKLKPAGARGNPPLLNC